MDGMAKREITTKNKGGRPKLELDVKLIENLAAIQCTYKEIAAVVGCSIDTLRDRFSTHIEKGQENGKQSLKRLQWKSAENGNVVMQVWLGKQWLGQRDKPPEEATNVQFNVHIKDVPD
jgi:hypothetical protein